MSFFGQIEGPIKSVLAWMFADEDLRIQITYRRFKQQGDFDAGSVEAQFDDFSIYAIRLRHTTESQFVGIGDIQLGDQLYMIEGENAPTGMSKKDLVVDELGIIQQIKAINNIFGLAVAVTVESGA